MIGIELVGRDGLDSREARVADILTRAAEAIAERARERLPAGSLSEAIGVVETDQGLTVEVRAGHAKFVEYGTSRMAARPFLTPAVESLRGRLRELLS